MLRRVSTFASIVLPNWLLLCDLVRIAYSRPIRMREEFSGFSCERVPERLSAVLIGAMVARWRFPAHNCSSIRRRAGSRPVVVRWSAPIVAVDESESGQPDTVGTSNDLGEATGH